MGLKICDKCYKLGDYRPSTRQITIGPYETFDLCESHCEEIIKYINASENGKNERNGRKRSVKTTHKTKKANA